MRYDYAGTDIFFFHSSKTVEDVVARYSGYGMAWYRYDDGDYLRRAFP